MQAVVNKKTEDRRTKVRKEENLCLDKKQQNHIQPKQLLPKPNAPECLHHSIIKGGDN